MGAKRSNGTGALGPYAQPFVDEALDDGYEGEPLGPFDAPDAAKSDFNNYKLSIFGGSRERALSAAKYTVGQVGTRLSREAVQLHGGIGMTWELPLAHYAKRLVMIDHQLGDEDHHLARYIALGR